MLNNLSRQEIYSEACCVRFGYGLRLSHASAELRELGDFSGHDEVLRVEPVGESEGREAP
jgi:hypothetical protein